METGILLESGTNELEILEFRVGNNCYGINVAKVREILPYKEPTLIPNAHPCIEGIFMPRDEIITIVDKNEYQHLMKYMAEVDPDAFMTVYTVKEIQYKPKV